jgi:hypothetical protein
MAARKEWDAKIPRERNVMFWWGRAIEDDRGGVKRFL